ncbi:UNVERIFIED_CONTAM: hypothetical protein Sradi_7016100 [Sesamum radiatum]|uniref:Uncharacterized protein n=1 Tax=Sesamum radiatum TaxID=300843 RepID=A0AAW2JBF9_SESRA
MKEEINCNVLTSQERFIHIRIAFDFWQSGFLCTWVYAKHTRPERWQLWDALRTINQGDDPWLLGGDFNIILCCSERKGGATPKIKTMEDFGDMMMNCELQDAGFKRAQFTWSGNDSTDSYFPTPGTKHFLFPVFSISRGMFLITAPFFS